MLTLHSALRDKIVAHARADHPDEACGVIAGPAGQDRPERFIPMLNAQRSPTFYEFDSMELLRVWREMDDRDEEPAVIYHSHTATEAYPSRTDISYANEPGAHYVLVSTRDPGTVEFRSFRIVDGTVTEEEVRITDDPQGDLSAYPGRLRPGMIAVGIPLASGDGRHRPRRGRRRDRPPHPGVFMAIEVRIPTILRTYTGGAKAVEGSGATIAELIGDLDTRFGGLRDRLQDEAGLRRFVNVYLNDEDVRFLGGLETPVKDGDTVTVLPAVAGGAG